MLLKQCGLDPNPIGSPQAGTEKLTIVQRLVRVILLSHFKFPNPERLSEFSGLEVNLKQG